MDDSADVSGIDDELRRLGQRRTFRRGQRLIFAGDTRGSVVLVESGHVKVVAVDDAGEESILAVRGPGDLLGDLSAMTGRPAGAEVVALGAVTATMVLGARYVALVEASPRLLAAQFRRLVAVLAESDAKLVQLATLDVRERVARRLVDLVAIGSESEGEGHRILVEVTHEELAAMCGASREAVSRAIAELRELGLVATDRRRVTVLDREGLDRVAARRSGG